MKKRFYSFYFHVWSEFRPLPVTIHPLPQKQGPVPGLPVYVCLCFRDLSYMPAYDPSTQGFTQKYPAARCTLVFPNYTVSDSNSVEKFLNKYKLNCNFTIDYDQKLTREWG